MKQLLFAIALVVLPLGAMTGCGGSTENKVIEGGSSEPVMSSDQMADYEAQMRSGAASSSPDSAPQAPPAGN